MEFKSIFPVITTDAMAEARDFYVQHLGFRVVFEADWYVQLHADRVQGGQPLELAFMKPDLESLPAEFRPRFNGEGVVITLEVDDVDSLYEKLHDAGVKMVMDLKDEAWGQRHFTVRDPSGAYLDVVKQIPPSSDYADAYKATAD